jgi:2-dehydropantoate 2-reductase
MRICIVGAGSIGGFLGARLARAGAAVTLVARGAHLAALRERGLRLIEADGRTDDYRVAVAASLAEVGQQDVVALGMKAHQVEAIVADLPRLLDAGTTVLPLQNGIPWWYFQRHGGPHEGRRVSAVDPRGEIAAAIPADSILGCVVYPACDLPAPGVVRHVEGQRFPLGELDGATSVRAQALSELFAAAGLKAPVLADIRAEIWLKLWGNLCFNPISALTRSTLDRICGEPLTRSLAAAMMREAEAVAGALGISFRVSLEHRIEGAARVGSHKTSMLQDIEAGRATEIDALLGAVIELARLTGTPAPNMEAMYACIRLLENTLRGPAALPVAPPAALAAARVA